MPHPMRTNVKAAKARRESALARGEIREPTVPRVFPAGATAPAMKIENPETRRMIDEFLARRGDAR